MPKRFYKLASAEQILELGQDVLDWASEGNLDLIKEEHHDLIASGVIEWKLNQVGLTMIGEKVNLPEELV